MDNFCPCFYQLKKKIYTPNQISFLSIIEVKKSFKNSKLSQKVVAPFIVCIKVVQFKTLVNISRMQNF